MSSTFGTLFKITTFGESHCKAVGVVIDGCPPGLELTERDIQAQLDRRRPGQSCISTDRKESDLVSILSGTEFGVTLGTPICLQVQNKDQHPGDYGTMSQIPRPSHADYTYQMKYGRRASSGGGRASARETVGTVAAGAIAMKILKEKYGMKIVAWVESVGPLKSTKPNYETITPQEVDRHITRCPDPIGAELMANYIKELKAKGDSTGGTIRCIVRHCPIGLGEPIFEKMEAKLAQAMLAIPASKGFEFGSGFEGTTQTGSVHNDPFVLKGDHLGTVTNKSGGIQGGITNGEIIDFRVGFKPTATISMEQKTANFAGEDTTLAAKGRHDPCVVPRAVPIVEAMTALVILDMAMRQESRRAFSL